MQGLLAAQRPDAALHGDFQAAAIVLDTRTSEVLAWVGSRDWSDRDALGGNDGVTARRQAGSALKPFIYARYLDDGHPVTSTFEDAPVAFDTPGGAYRPQNYDRHYHGTVTLRVALASSLNIPAIRALHANGVKTTLDFLHALGLATLDRSAEDYGLGLALGDGDVRLVDLANAYATLGRLGRWRPVTWTLGARPTGGGPDPLGLLERQVFSRDAALEILDILSDDRARGIGFGHGGPLALAYRVAAKTGTSSDYRDNWAFGVTPDYTVGVWVGNFDGRPMNRVSGPIGASPLLRQIFQILYPRAATRADVAWFPAPPHDASRLGAASE
ncbi:MAG: penicillin-binding transpeptidase domain-containing protein [Myxococcota bacterium]